MESEYLHAHEAHKHGDASMHHHHSHATSSHHAHGHHLLQVEDLCVSFSMYDPDETHFFRARKKDVSVISDLSISYNVCSLFSFKRFINSSTVCQRSFLSGAIAFAMLFMM